MESYLVFKHPVPMKFALKRMAGTDLALQSRHPASLLKGKASPQNVGGDAPSRGQREAPGPHKYSRARIGMNRRFRRIAAVLEDDD